MGYLEAAVVTYLRATVATGAVVPARDPATLDRFETMEIARELATLAMVAAALAAAAAVSALAGRSSARAAPGVLVQHGSGRRPIGRRRIDPPH